MPSPCLCSGISGAVQGYITCGLLIALADKGRRRRMAGIAAYVIPSVFLWQSFSGEEGDE